MFEKDSSLCFVKVCLVGGPVRSGKFLDRFRKPLVPVNQAFCDDIVENGKGLAEFAVLGDPCIGRELAGPYLSVHGIKTE